MKAIRARSGQPRWLAALAATMIVTAIAAPGSTALAGAPAPRVGSLETAVPTWWTSTPESYRVWAWQQTLVPLRSVLDPLIAATPAVSGYSLDNDTRSIRIYGRGPEAPAPIAELMSSELSSVPIQWIAVGVPLSDLERVLNLLTLRHDLVAGGSIGSDFAHLGVSLQPGVTPEALLRDIDTAGVRIEFNDENRYEALAGGRGTTTGSESVRGGMRIFRPLATGGSTACSSGFRVLQNGNARMLTAAHCTVTQNSWGGEPNANFQFLGTGRTAGTSTNTVSRIADVQALDGASWSSEIYLRGAGAQGDPPSPQIPITSGTGQLTNGDLVCVSGGFSGENCGQVVSTFASYSSCSLNNSMCAQHTDLMAVRGQDAGLGFGMAGEGDSGSPMVVPSNGGATYRAAGILSGGGSNIATCTGLSTFGYSGSPSRKCYTQLAFAPWFRFRDNFSPPLTFP